MKNQKRFKIRYIGIPLLGIMCLFVGFVRIVVFPDGFGMPMDYRIAFFGKTYAELYSFQTQAEKKVGEDIVAHAKACMEYKDDEQSAPEADKLARYYYFPHYERPARTDVDIQLVKCVVHGEKGSVWFNYSLEWFDENDKRTQGAWNILTRCAIQKDASGDWVVTSVSEPP